MQASKTITRASLVIGACLFLSAAAMVATFVLFQQAEKDLEAAFEQRYSSYLLADELRQSSDDLTRFARSYVATGNEHFKEMYNQILAIRNGEAPRPEGYNRIYWDFVAATGEPPRGTGKAVSLSELMREAGFTEAEFAKLEKAQANSDGLVKLETKAMGVVGDGDASAGELREARKLLFGEQYHAHKANIMKPIDEFFVMLDERTAGAVEAARSRVSMYSWMFGVSITVAVLLALLAGLGLYSRVLRPVGRLRDAMLNLSENKQDTEIPGVENRDEVGEMARATEVFKTNMVENDRLREQQADQERQAAEERRAAMHKLADGFEGSVGSVVDNVARSSGQLEELSRTLSHHADKTKTESTAVSSAAEQAASNLQAVASATEELSTSVREIASQAEQSAQIAQQASDQSARTTETIQGLATAADRIGQVVTLINDIAEQTNLLALNATIEAARAGEAGKGFAVVAQEVKTLAEQTGKATQDIQHQIEAIQGETREAVSAIDGISDTVKHINESVAAISSAVQEQEATTGEIARNIEDVTKASETVAQSIGGVRDIAEETNQSAERLRSESATFQSGAKELRGEVDRFLGEVRAA
jgi:methyl-accepting chemotaxis protein